MEQHHYFLNTSHNEEDYFSFTSYFLNKPYTFKSCSDVFSKNEIDYGTRVLLKTIIEKLELSGKVLDVGCGYGVIGIILKQYYPQIELSMIDINETAIKLSNENLKEYNLKASCFVSNLYDKINFTIDHIVTNPPIKAGKENLFNVVTGAVKVLNKLGTITLVIKKKHGMESLKNKMQDTFGNVEILKRDNGYYILHSVKQ